jgi:hypothetical protein
MRSDDTGQVALTVLVVHLALLAYVVLCHVFMLQGDKTGLQLVRAAVVRWDAVHFFQIAREGYSEPHLASKLPLFPLLLAGASVVLRDPVVAGLALALLGHLVAGYFLYRLAGLDLSAEQAWRSLVFFLIYPTAFALVVPYTEGPFMAFLLAGVYGFRTRRYGWAAVLGFLAALTRLNGFMLSLLYLVEYLTRQREDTRRVRVAAAVVLPCLALLVHMGTNYYFYKDPLQFISIHQQLSTKRLASPHVGLLQAWQSLDRPRPENITEGFSDLLGGLLPWVVAVYAFRRLRPSYGAFALMMAVGISFQSWWQSSLRYSLAVFPVYLMLGRLSERPWARTALAAVCLVLLALLALQYGRGWWAF